MAFELNYSAMDRLLHRLAFGVPDAQLIAASVEGTAFGSSYAQVEARRPIFLTSLPRAGTTVLLEALHRLPTVATHTYRDMPFVLAPVLWARFSGGFQRKAELSERAHGDGLEVGYDSPEAFEEVFWRAFWSGHYGPERITLWRAADAKADATEFLRGLMKKVVALRRPDHPQDGRYLSKNNANVARLELLPRAFPDASLLIPVRQPLEQATSLLRQHVRFLEVHQREPFSRRYMGDIGHYEFGALHRPFAFPGLEEALAERDPTTIDYWLAYWTVAFEHVLAYRGEAVVTSYEATCADPAGALAALAERLELPTDGALDDAAAAFRPAPPPRGDASAADPALLRRADELHHALVGGRA